MSVDPRWPQELEAPTPAFFGAFAARAQGPDGVRDAVREAVKALVPRIDWEAYLPHHPHGILGLRAVLRLQELLPERAFLRALAVQLHMAAHEGRRAQPLPARGSDGAANLEAFVRARRPALAYAEAQGVDLAADADFQRLGDLVALDMGNVGHKAVVADHLGDLHRRLDHPRATGRRLLGLAALVAAGPEDAFWARRAGRRLGADPPPVPWEAAPLGSGERGTLVRDLCDAGLVALLDTLAARLQAGQGARDTLEALVLAATEKLLDARRDLEGKTAWTLVYLATLARRRAEDPRVWCQAAALVNLFPTDDPEGRVAPRSGVSPDAEGLREAVLDGDAPQAMAHAAGLAAAGQVQPVLRALAETAAANDAAFNHAHQLLAVAAAADLLPSLSPDPAAALLAALAKSLANSQGSGDLGRLAEKALG